VRIPQVRGRVRCGTLRRSRRQVYARWRTGRLVRPRRHRVTVMLQDERVPQADDAAREALAHRPHLDPASMRAHYRAEGLREEDLADDPYEQFLRWFEDAVTAGLHEPNAMVVSTADDRGRPSSRTVLLKQFDERGFVFYTNYGSRKGREIEANPYVSLL